MTRREFVKACLLGLAGLGVNKLFPGCARQPGSTRAVAAEAAAGGSGSAPGVGSSPGIKQKPVTPPCDIAVAKGDDIGDTTRAALEAYGGLEQFVGKDDKVVLKPNLAWSRTPEQAANTHPAVLAAVLEELQKIGPAELVVVEHPCDSAEVSFELSGAKRVCADHNVPLICPASEQMYTPVEYPNATKLKSDAVITEIMEATVYINMPVVKVHGSGVVTVTLKNQMGSVWNRGTYHRTGLHQCIADAATGLQPTLNVVDASRVLLTRGPKGPGQVERPGEIIVSTDMVATDSYCCGLLGKSPQEVSHIMLAAEAGVGTTDLDSLNITRATA